LTTSNQLTDSNYQVESSIHPSYSIMGLPTAIKADLHQHIAMSLLCKWLPSSTHHAIAQYNENVS